MNLIEGMATRQASLPAAATAMVYKPRWLQA
jgi:hypothetical protein